MRMHRVLRASRCGVAEVQKQHQRAPDGSEGPAVAKKGQAPRQGSEHANGMVRSGTISRGPAHRTGCSNREELRMRGTISITGAGLALAALFVSAPSAIGAEPAGYRLVSEMKLPGAVAGWDYLSFDEQNRRLFISRRTLGEFVYAPD